MNLDRILTFLAACLGALAVADPVGVPLWVQITASVLAVGFAAIGVYPQNVTPTRTLNDR